MLWRNGAVLVLLPVAGVGLGLMVGSIKPITLVLGSIAVGIVALVYRWQWYRNHHSGDDRLGR